mmetsp:Transcript_41365/g.96566  ORF Transcript_41365/g.96566 Transcript_41365/m.96566 type:complete len:210 (-) Transcript_41365:484-1113(-)
MCHESIAPWKQLKLWNGFLQEEVAWNFRKPLESILVWSGCQDNENVLVMAKGLVSSPNYELQELFACSVLQSVLSRVRAEGLLPKGGGGNCSHGDQNHLFGRSRCSLQLVPRKPGRLRGSCLCMGYPFHRRPEQWANTSKWEMAKARELCRSDWRHVQGIHRRHNILVRRIKLQKAAMLEDVDFVAVPDFLPAAANGVFGLPAVDKERW